MARHWRPNHGKKPVATVVLLPGEVYALKLGVALLYGGSSA